MSIIMNKKLLENTKALIYFDSNVNRDYEEEIAIMRVLPIKC